MFGFSFRVRLLTRDPRISPGALLCTKVADYQIESSLAKFGQFLKNFKV